MLLSLKETIDKHQLMAQKSLGQNFLLDSNITNKIINTSLQKQGLASFVGYNICEVGPGPGGLTRSILEQNPDSLTVIEMDNRCIKIMEELKEHYQTNFTIINNDALKVDISSTCNKPCQIISNLPYNVSVPLLIGWLKNIKKYCALTLMFQKEVADRILSSTKSKDYGRISVLAQLTCNIERLVNLSPECFTPAPKIWSSVLLFSPKAEEIDAKLLSTVEKITTTAFGQRRKMLRQSLKSMPEVLLACNNLEIPTTLRAEELAPNQYLELAKAIS